MPPHIECRCVRELAKQISTTVLENRIELLLFLVLDNQQYCIQFREKYMGFKWKTAE